MFLLILDGLLNLHIVFLVSGLTMTDFIYSLIVIFIVTLLRTLIKFHHPALTPYSLQSRFRAFSFSSPLFRIAFQMPSFQVVHG